MFPGGYSPLHKHAWEHSVFVLEGDGLVFDGKKNRTTKTGDAVFIGLNDLHQFKNKSQKTLTFICIDPFAKE